MRINGGGGSSGGHPPPKRQGSPAATTPRHCEQIGDDDAPFHDRAQTTTAPTDRHGDIVGHRDPASLPHFQMYGRQSWSPVDFRSQFGVGAAMPAIAGRMRGSGSRP